MAEATPAARKAAELMAALCSSAATAYDRHELALLVERERITLSDFCAALSDLADERGAAAYEWEQDEPSRFHDWRLEGAIDRPISRQVAELAELDVRLVCTRCAAVATFRAGAVPPCQSGQLWQFTGKGWQRTEEKG